MEHAERSMGEPHHDNEVNRLVSVIFLLLIGTKVDDLVTLEMVDVLRSKLGLSSPCRKVLSVVVECRASIANSRREKAQ